MPRVFTNFPVREQTRDPMSLPKTLPFRKPLGIAGSLPHVFEIKSAKPFDTAVNLSLPSRIAVIGTVFRGSAGLPPSLPTCVMRFRPNTGLNAYLHCR